MFAFDNTYVNLPDRFRVRLDPTPVASPLLIKLNTDLASDLGLDPAALRSSEGVSILAGNVIPHGASPIATAYAGHQFGRFVPQLGDGRAILLGEIKDSSGTRHDIQLKGSGPTPFSRSGDGRAALGPVLREYIVSEAMAALGIPTTRALAAVATGEWVYRDTILPGAVLTRVSRGLVRVGTFQYFAARNDTDAIRALADYTISRHYPDASRATNAYSALLQSVVEAQAKLIARWMLVGFIHGVMNTDNMSIAGETIDYGPCAFIDTFHPATVYSSIDHAGRYAYANQPRVAQWNLVQFAQCLLPVIADDEADAIALAQASVDTFPELYQAAWIDGMRAKLGLLEKHDGDRQLAEDLFAAMTDDKLDFTNTFRQLCDLVAPGNDRETNQGVQPASQETAPAFDDWLVKWHQRLAQESAAPDDRLKVMRSKNPAFIPRNHRVDAALRAAISGDLEPFDELIRVLSKPFADQPEHAAYADPPRPEEVVQATFCGT